MSNMQLKNCLVFDGHEAKLQESVSILIADGEIQQIEAEETATISHAVAIDCGGRVVMPGLIDAHVHAYTPTLDFYANDLMPSALIVSHAADILEGMLMRGFTTVRDAAGGDKGLWLAIEQGLIKGPRLFYPGKALSQTGGHGDMRPADTVDHCLCGSYSGLISKVVDGVDEMRKAVREELRQGAHQIKLFVSGGVTSPTDPIWMNQFTDEEISAAVYEAATYRRYVMAHCHTDEAVRRCVELGVRSIEHGSVITETTAQLMAECNVFLVPTLSVARVVTDNAAALGLPPMSLHKVEGLYEQMLNSVKICHRAGVKVGLGSDLLGSDYHPRQAGELVLRGEVSSALDVLRSATSINAELLQKENELGCIKEGAKADLLVLDFNPLKDLTPFNDPLRSISLVMKGGGIVRSNL